jgi:hypothetical protein
MSAPDVQGPSEPPPHVPSAEADQAATVQVHPYTAGRNATATRSTAATLGAVLALVAGVCGLVLIGFIILVLVSLNSYGSNK